MKRENELLAISIASAMLSVQTSDTQFKKATIEDQEKELELAVLTFGKKAKAFHDNRRKFLKINPDMSYYLYDREHLVASINMLPLKHEGIVKFREGVRGWLLGEYIEQYIPGKPLEIIIIDMMTTPLVPPDRRTQYAMHLFFGLIKKLVEWGKQGIEIERVLANGGTLEGRRLLETAGFAKLGEKAENRIIYELEIATSDLNMLTPYKNALDEQKTTQRKYPTTKISFHSSFKGEIFH